jgi:hypothetical protein
VNRGHPVGIEQVERVERAVDEHARCVKHRPHRSVRDEHALVDGLEERLH